MKRAKHSAPRCCAVLFLKLSVGAVCAAAAMPAAVGAELQLEDTGEGAARRIAVEHPDYRLVINPAFGGRIESLIDKHSGVDLTRFGTSRNHGGLLADGVWQQSFWHGDWNDEPYAVSIVSPSASAARLTLTRAGELWEDVTISKTITCSADVARIHVDYAIGAGPLVHEHARPELHFVQAMAKRGRVYAVSPTGLRTMPHWHQEESWVPEPARNWLAWLPEHGGPGLLATVPDHDLRFLRATHGEVDTLEFVLRKIDLDPDTTFRTSLTLQIVRDLRGVTNDLPRGPVVEPPARRTPAADVATKARYNPKDLDFSSLAVETPHRDWAKRYAGRTPRVLALLPGHYERQAIELAQRFEMDLTCSFLSTFAHNQVSTYFVLGDRVTSLRVEELHDHLGRVLAREYDVILTSYDTCNGLPERFQQAILSKVEAGAGLVYVLRGNPPPMMEPLSPFVFHGYDWATGRLIPTEVDSPLAKAIPFSVMPVNRYSNGMSMQDEPGEAEVLAEIRSHQTFPMVVADRHGAGRLVWMMTGPPLLPPFHKQQEEPAFDYVEYQMAFIARLMYWAARCETTLDIEGIEPAAGGVRVEMTSRAAGEVDLELTVRDVFGEVVTSGTTSLQLEEGRQAVTLPAPRTGIERALLADVIARNADGTLAWGAGVFPKSSSTTIAALELDREHYDPGEDARVTVRFNGLVPLESSVRLSLYDGYGRLGERVETDATDVTTATVPLRRALGTWFRLRGEYIMNGVVVDQAWVEGELRRRPDPRRLMTTFWSWPQTGPRTQIENGYQLFLRMGMRGHFGVRDAHAYEIMREMDMPYDVSMMGMYANRGTSKSERKAPEDPQQPRPVYAPADAGEMARRREQGAAAARERRHEPLLMVSMGDENRGPGKDIGFSDEALAEFRAWLRAGQYESLDALNAEWGTSFARWDDVVPMTEEEAKAHGGAAGSFAPWSDHRLYLKWAYARMARESVAAVLAGDPRALPGVSGTQESAPHGGRDWWHLARAYPALAAYGGHQAVEQRSFNPDMIRRPWAGYSKPNPFTRSGWRILFDQAQGFHVFSAPNHINPDYTLPMAGRDLKLWMQEVMRGPGQLLVDAAVSHDGVYILQSPMTIHVAYLLGEYPAWRDARTGAEQMLEALAVGYRAVSYEQLGNGDFDKMPARALVLPHAFAMSEAEAAAVQRFVERGGVVIADRMPAAYTGHGRRREQSALAALADNEKFVLLEPSTFIAYAEELRLKLMEEPEAMARNEAVLEELGRVLRQAGVGGAFAVRNREGAAGNAGQRTYWLWTGVKDHGPNRYVLLMRNYCSTYYETPDQPVTVTFEREAHLYDVLDGAYLGRRREIDLTFASDTLRIFALMAYRVDRLELEAPERWRAGRDATLRAQVFAEGAAAADHVLHVDVIDPAGLVRRAYSQDLRAAGGEADWPIPFALNDPAGDWRVVVTDAATGARAEAVIALAGGR